MINQTSPTRALLMCGVVGGPLYVIVTLAQALTRDGFDMKHHRFTLLTAGDLGWIHQSNMVVVGILTMLFAVGVSHMLRSGRGAVWAPRLLALLGLADMVGGLLTSDPAPGFPPGTTADMAHHTVQAAVQNASRSISTLLLIATSLVIAAWFAGEGRRAWAWFYGTAIPIVFVTLAVVGFAVGTNPVAPAFLATPWIWVTALAVHLERLAATRGDDVAADQETRTAQVAG